MDTQRNKRAAMAQETLRILEERRNIANGKTVDISSCLSSTNHVFDVWAGDYDEDVRLSDENNEYPFAGYKKIMDSIFSEVVKKNSASVLDIGIGTGTLAAALYKHGQIITGIDFSNDMLSIAKQKMPNAMFYKCDFVDGLPPEIMGTKYDFIISTYALHHLPDTLKVTFIKSLLPYLNANGAIFIGDIGFTTRAQLNKCREQNADEWDDNEYCFVFSEMSDALKCACSVTYTQMSHCGGVMEIRAL